METGVQVGDAMTLKPITVGPNATLLACAQIMAKEHVGSLLVIENQKVLGLFTEQDMVRKGMLFDKPPSEISSKEIMETKLITITPDKDLAEAMQLLRDNNIRHLPVVHDGKLAGLLTGKDILKLQPDLFEIIANKIELREEDRKNSKGTCQACGNYADDLEDKEGELICEQCRE